MMPTLSKSRLIAPLLLSLTVSSAGAQSSLPPLPFLSIPVSTTSVAIAPISQQGLRLAPLSQFDPSGLVAMARSAGCSVRALAPYTLSTRKLGMVSIQEYQISSSCTVFNADNQPEIGRAHV